MDDQHGLDLMQLVGGKPYGRRTPARGRGRGATALDEKQRGERVCDPVRRRGDRAVKLRRLTIAGFGRLAGRTFAFADGLNVIYGPNEAGKSTLAAAIVASVCPVRLRTMVSLV